MRPALLKGKMVLCEVVPPEKLRAGDMVAYEISGKKFIHRIKDIITDGPKTSFLISSDSSACEPHLISYGQIQGRAVSALNGGTGLIFGTIANFVYSCLRGAKYFFSGKQTLFFLIPLLLLLAQFVSAAERIKTVEWNFGGYYNAADAATWSPPYLTVNLPDTSGASPIKNAYLEIEYLTTNNADTSNIDVYFSTDTVPGGPVDAITGPLIPEGSGESDRMCIRVDVTSKVTKWANQSYSMRTVLSGSQANMFSARLYITYYYDDTAVTQVKTVRFPIFSGSADGVSGVASSLNQQTAPYTLTYKYYADIPETGNTLKQVWFDIKGYRQNTGLGADGSLYCKIGTSGKEPTMYFDDGRGDSYNFRYISSTGTPSGFSVNSLQSLNIITTGDMTTNTLGGEVVITYEFSNAASTKIKTISYFMGQSTGAAGALSNFTIPLYLREPGASIKRIYAIINGSYDSTTALNLTVDSGVDGSAAAARTYSIVVTAAEISGFEFFHDLTEKAASWSDGANVNINWDNTSAALGGTGVELIVTYSYTSEYKFTDSYRLFAGQSSNETASGGTVSDSPDLFFPDPETPIGTKTLRSAHLKANFIEGDKNVIQDPTTTINVNGSAAQLVKHHSTSENFHVPALYDFFERISPSSASFTANYTLTADPFSVSGCANIVYDYIPVPNPPTALEQYKTDGLTNLAAADWTNESAVKLKFTMSGKFSGDTFYPVVEVKPVNLSFDGIGLSTGSSAVYSGSDINGEVLVSTGQGEYQWRASISGSGGRSSWVNFGVAGSRHFGVDLSSPTAPALSSPPDGAVYSEISQTFSWSAVSDSGGSGIRDYLFHLSTSADFGNIYYSSQTANLSVAVPALAQKQYYWRARADDAAGNTGDWSGYWSVLIDSTPPSQVTALNTPLNNVVSSHTVQTFSWNAAGDDLSGIKQYALQVSTSADFVPVSYSSHTSLTSANLDLSESSYTWRVNAIDYALNYTTSTLRYSLLVDTSPANPVTALISPLNNFTTNYLTLNFNWAGTSDSLAGVGSYILQISTSQDFIPVRYSSNTAATTASLSVIQSSYTWRVNVADNAQNYTSSTARGTVIVDTTAPPVPSLSEPLDSSTTSQQSLSFLWQAVTDLGAAGTAVYGFEISREVSFDPVLWSSSPLTNAARPPDLEQGLYRWRARAVDAAQNISAFSNYFTVGIDTTPPSIPLLSAPLAQTATNQLSILFQWEASVENGTAGLRGYTLVLSTSDSFIPVRYSSATELTYATISDIQPDPYFWKVLAIDTVNNYSQYSSTNSLMVDNAPPQIIIGEGLAGGDTTWHKLNTTLFDVDFNASGGAALDHFQILVSTNLNGQAPLKDWTDSGVPISGQLTFSDDWLLSDSIWQALLQDTTNFVSLRLHDLSGNTSTYMDAFFIKRQASSIKVQINEVLGEDSVWRSTSTRRAYDVDFFSEEPNNLAGAQYTAYAAANMGGGDALFDWAAVPGFTPGTTYYTTDWMIEGDKFQNLIDANTNYISVRCWDTAGSTVTARDAFVVKKDTSPPLATILFSPLQGEATGQRAVRFAWEPSADLASGTTIYYLEVSAEQDFASITYSSHTVSASLISSELDQSTYYWRVKANDGAGNWSLFYSSWSVQVDTTAPSSPSLAAPLNAFTTNYTEQTFQWSASVDAGPAGLSSYKINISTSSDFVPLFRTELAAVNSLTVSMTDSGTYYWKVCAMDRASNFSLAGATWTVVIDTITPLPPILSLPLANYTTNSVTLTLSWTGEDAGPAGILDYDLEISTFNGFSSLYYSSTTTLGSHTTTFIQNEYWWRALSRDRAGNTIFSSSRTFIVDISSPPVAVLSSPADDTRTNNLTNTFSWGTVADAGPAGIAQYRLSISTDSGFGIINFSSVTALNSAEIIFDAGNIYYWRVCSQDRAGNISELCSPFSLTIDTVTPSVSNNQSGDDSWRDTASAVYNVDFFDTPAAYGAGLAEAQYRVYSATTPAGAPFGAELSGYKTIFTKTLPERTSYYMTDWDISASWPYLKQGYNFVFTKASDLAGNAYEPEAYSFYVKKDTAAPETISYESAPSWENSDRARNVDFSDYGSGVTVGSYTAHSLPDRAGSPLIGWTTAFYTSAVNLWSDDWSLAFNLLGPGTNYISLRYSDALGNIGVSTDTFVVWKDTIAPNGITNLGLSNGTPAGSLKLSWAAPSDEALTDPVSRQVKLYLVKYKTTPFLNSSDFLETGTTFFQNWQAQPPSSPEENTVTGLTEGTSYYIGISAIDKASNKSSLVPGSTNYFWATRVAPAKITDLTASAPDTLDPGSLELTWTSVGDDDKDGTASGYILKYATFSFTADMWNAVNVSTYTPSTSWSPGPSGSSEDRIVAGLSIGTTYFFAMKVFDDASPGENYSLISNTVSIVSRSAGPADGMLCYADGILEAPSYYKTTGAGTSWTGPISANNTAATNRWVLLRTCPVLRNEKLLTTLSSGGQIYTQRWDGQNNSWDSSELQTTIASADSVYRPFDTAYEQNSGRAMLVYRSAVTGQVYYRIWSSTQSAWVNSATALSMGGTGLVRWVRLEPRPGTDEIMLVTMDANADIYAYRWNGSAWSDNRLMTASARVATQQCFDVAWENTRGAGMVLWGEARATNYALWSSNAWSVVGAAGPNIAATPNNGANWVKLSADRDSDSDSNNIAMSCLDSNSDWSVSIWDGNSWAAPNELSAAMIANSSRLTDIAWEKDTGRCLAVAASTGTNGQYIMYTTWSGAWSALSTYYGYSLGNSYNILWTQLIPDPNSNRIVLACSNAATANSVSIRSLNWSGSSWSGGSPLTTSASNNAYEQFSLSLDRHDIIAPQPPVNNQSGDSVWRSTNSAVYDVDFVDNGDSHLAKLQAQLDTAPGGASVYRTWSDELTGINADTYDTNWPLSMATWDALKAGQNYISLRIIDGVGNYTDRTDAFYVLKDTQAPSISASAAPAGWYNAEPALITSAAFSDQGGLSLLTSAQYLIYPQPGNGGTKISQGIIFDFMPARVSSTSYISLNTGHWDLLNNTSNFVTLQCFDVAGNTTTVVDAFVIRKDTVAPSDITSLSAAAGPYRGAIDLSWIAPGDDGLISNNTEGSYLVKFATYAITAPLFDSASTYAQSMTPRNSGLLETITIAGLSVDTTYYFAVKTKDKGNNWAAVSNSTSTLPRTQNIYINEVFASGAAGADWIELYNNIPGAPQSLTGWTLAYNQGTIDNPGSESTVWTGGAGDTVDQNSIFTLTALDLNGAASYHAKLKNPQGATVSEVQWPASATGESFARITDGNYDYFEIDPSPTKNYSNAIATAPVKINEVDYASSHQAVELYNTSEDTPTLSGWSVRNLNRSRFSFTRVIYPKSFTGLDASSIDDGAKSWTSCFGTSGLAPLSDFLALENDSGQVADRVTWKDGGGVNTYYNYKAELIPYLSPAPGGVLAPDTISRGQGDGSDSEIDNVDFDAMPASLGMRNNNPSPMAATELNYPSSAGYMPRTFKFSLKFNADPSGGRNDTLWFVRTGGSPDGRSPHIYRLSDMGIDLNNNLTVQTTIQTGLAFNDLQGYPLADGSIYKLLLNSDSSTGASQQASCDSLVYDATVHEARAFSAVPAYINTASTAAVLRLDISNRSPQGANPVELSSVKVKFYDADGNAPLTTPQAKAIFTSVILSADSNSLGTLGTYQSAVDSATLCLVENADISLDTEGTLTLANSIPDSPESCIIAYSTRTYFISVAVAPAAAASFSAKIIASTATAWRDGPSDVAQPSEAGPEVMASSPTIVVPAAPPSGTVYPAPIAPAGTIITTPVMINGNADTSFTGTSDGKLYALNKDGTPKWEFNAGSPVTNMYETSYLGVEASSFVYVATQSGMLYKLRDAENDYSLEWGSPRNLGGSVTSDLIYSSYYPYFYIGNSLGQLYKIAPTGSDVSGWNSNTGLSGSVTGSPVVDEYSLDESAVPVNAVWLVTDGGDACRLNNIDGGVTSASNNGFSIHTSPFLTSGFLSASKNTHDIYFGDDNGILRARTSSNMTSIPSKWHDVVLSSAIKSSPYYFFDSNSIFFGCDNGKLYRVDASSGDVYWTFQTGGPIRTNPVAVVTNYLSGVFFGSDDGYFYGLDLDTGALLPNFPIMTGGEVRGSPVVDAGYAAYTYNSVFYPAHHEGTDYIYFSSNDGKVYCVEAP
ncbi:MAG TPA: hypothetical protein DEE98_02760 [Elusimicrobia bacterium]|nr:MAG: hypothetical protein A2251_02675 [Elusimicrobia bacterium RIFOXYA2_FULL_47_53]OGS26697.1 MAG: hypothetical protein A2339_03725 [Elusimicrobia bacterium RIFOXYB12_FULL_50_12]OGS30177.1 MAG: hypothetical protein A2323_01860 [Elusimicrobia bacterium RIFOXYB2_FULL_46_23]HBU69286.1 hypothetical protein [Elusimicrobiota bacterium]